MSVVIPVLNGARFLGRQLGALCEQGTGAFEIVIADNGSTDDSLDIARSFADRLSLVIVDASENHGQAFARNKGAFVARGDILLFLDQDDAVAPGYVATMSAALGRAELVGSRMDADLLNPGWRRRGRELPQTAALPLDPVPWAYGCTLGIRRATFGLIGGFAEDLNAPAGEDVDLCWRAHKLGIGMEFVPDAVVHYQFPSSLRAFFRQGRRYGFAGAVVAARHGAAPKLSWRATVTSFLGPTRLVLLGWSKGKRAQGLFLLGRRLGTRKGLRTLGRAIDRSIKDDSS